MGDLKAIRRSIRLSLTALAHQAGVSRFRLWSSERGDVTLSTEEKARICRVLRAEAERLEGVFAALDLADIAA
jgi:DNA-binding XRE family transcriptional regulator